MSATIGRECGAGVCSVSRFRSPAAIAFSVEICGNPLLKEMANGSSTRAGTLLEQASEEPPAVTAEEDRKKWKGLADQGGFPEAVVRILIAMIGADNVYDVREFDVLKE